jgi:2,4'-dihydroxyacetophenone dioxygenase
LDRRERIPGRLRSAAPQAHGSGLRTTSGAWKYKEYDYVNRAGSFLYEPAGSVHALQALEDDTHVWFQMYGANLNLDADGNVESVVDGALTLAAYYVLCAAEGLPRPNVLVG